MECGSECFNWPLPDLSCLPCLPPGVQPEKFCELLDEANETVYNASGGKFRGCECWAELQICPTSCRCDTLCGCDPCFLEKVDLSHFLCAPVWEVLSVKVDGQELSTTEGFSILEECYLLCPPNGWPQQYLQNGPTGECTWTVTVRYGQKVPRRLVRLRDQYFFSLLKECYPSGYLSCDKEGVTKITTKAGTYEFAQELTVLEKIGCEFGFNPAAFAGFFDPGNPDLMYKVLTISKGSLGEAQDCIQHVTDFYGDAEEDPEPLQYTGKVYNKLGQLVS